MARLTKDAYYLNLAREAAKRGTCLRRNYGAVIVKNDQIIATGYTGAPRGTANCIELGFCARNVIGAKAGERYDICRSVHAEMNAIIHADRQDMIGATMYVAGIDMENQQVLISGMPCFMCQRFILNAGIETVVCHDPQTVVKKVSVSDLLYLNNLEVRKLRDTYAQA